MTIKRYIPAMIVVLGFTVYTGRDIRDTGFPAGYPVLHPRFREWPAPARGVETRFNPPVLQWPASSGKKVSYDVRLSDHAAFSSPSPFHAEGLPWTLFNPHRSLSPGMWYWQYRLHGGDWSAIDSFRITASATGFASPPVSAFLSGIPAAHPRVLLNSADTGIFRSECRNDPGAEAIILEADGMLRQPLLHESQGEQNVHGKKEFQDRKLAQNASMRLSNHMYHAVDHFCKAYLLTGNTKYIQPAIAYGMEVASWDPGGLTSLSDFGDARCMFSMALVFDTFHGDLSATQKDSLINAVDARAERFYEGWVNSIDAKVLSNHVWQYILDYFLSSAVALYGESGHAPDWIRYAYELWLARAPVLGGDDGAWVNGFSYFRLNMETLLDIPMFIKDYTGFDFISKNPWYRKNPDWLVYGFPPGSSSDGFGDNCEELFAPGQEYLAWSDALSRLLGSGEASWYSSRIAETGTLTLPDAPMLRWFRLRYLRHLKPASPSDPTLNERSKAFFGAGVVELHSDPGHTQYDLMVAMRSSPFGSYGHMLADQNTFQVLGGGKRLFYNSGYKIDMKDPHRLGWYKHTRGHNGVLIDNLGQPFGSEAYGYIARFIDGQSLSYAVGDASKAYNSAAEDQDAGLKTFRRHILFIRSFRGDCL